MTDREMLEQVCLGVAGWVMPPNDAQVQILLEMIARHLANSENDRD